MSRAGNNAAVDVSNLYYNFSNSYGDFYNGNVTINGQPVYTVGYVDKTGQVGMIFGQTSTETAFLAGGAQVKNIPAGSYTYSGTNVFGLRDGTYGENGTFAMSVNFNTGQASLSGSTASTTIGGTGIEVNSSTGNFSGNSLTVTVSDGINTASIPAAIDGSFHGDGATAVTGIYYDTRRGSPVGMGGIAGLRN